MIRKIIHFTQFQKMKKLIVFLILSSLLSCRETCRYNLYRIENQSTHVITVINYTYYYYQSPIDTITIEPQSVYELTGTTHGGKTPSIATEFLVSDSMKVCFDTLRSITYYCEPTFSEPRKRNLLDPNSSFEKFNCRKNNGCDYRFVFTDDDFNVAKEITK